MLNDEDVQKIVGANKEVFVTKTDFGDFKKEMIKAMSEVFPTKVDMDNKFDEIRKDFSNLLTSVDTYAKKADDYFQEMVMLSRKVNRNEKWIQQLA